jgi:hypothetical protein
VISVALWRRIFLAKNHPAKNIPPLGIFFQRKLIQLRILLAKKLPGEEFSGEKSSAFEKKFSGEEFSANLFQTHRTKKVLGGGRMRTHVVISAAF